METKLMLDLREKGLSFPKIARQLGISIELLRYRMNKIGIFNSVPEHNPFANSKYSYDYNFFDNIDTQEKAYILGLFYADGNNYVGERHSKVSIVLQNKDSYILDKINIIFKSCRPLQSSNKGTVKILHLSGKNISNQLSRLGCVPAKSLILTFPTKEQVPENLQSHFVRGYFDGDGCISYGKSYKIISIAGTKSFLEQMSNILNIKSKIRSTKNIYEYRICNKKSIKEFYEYVYTNSTIHFDRKYNKFLELFKTY